MNDIERKPGSRQGLELEISDLRAELAIVVKEVERRARAALDVKRQVRLHPVVTAAVLTGVSLGLLFAITYPIHKRRQRARTSRLHNLRIALAHLMAHPEDVTERKPAKYQGRLLGASKAVGSFGAKRALRRWLS